MDAQWKYPLAPMACLCGISITTLTTSGFNRRVNIGLVLHSALHHVERWLGDALAALTPAGCTPFLLIGTIGPVPKASMGAGLPMG